MRWNRRSGQTNGQKNEFALFLLEFQMEKVLTLEVFYYSTLTLIFIGSLILQNGIQNGLENGQAKILRLYTWVELD